MVKVELSYNPYIMETTVKFNGKVPRINSLVEKYEKNMLQDWIKRIPAIFHDEMNGYDFDLEFSGTEMDFAELTRAFRKAGVKEEQVRLFHKNNLEDRQEKCREIEELLLWLRSNPNIWFDAEDFFKRNRELLEGLYTCILINGRDLKYDNDPLEGFLIENIDEVSELENTELTYTPIVFCLDGIATSRLQAEVLQLFKKKEIRENQVFFYSTDRTNIKKQERILRDLGVKDPQLISSFEDKPIRVYILSYPVTEFIQEAVAIFKLATGTIQEMLNKQHAVSKITNKEVREKVDALEDRIKRLKNAKAAYDNKDNLIMPGEIARVEDELYSKISTWKNRKTKITRISDAEILAKEFESDICEYYKTFADRMTSILDIASNQVQAVNRNIYKQAGIALKFSPAASYQPVPVKAPPLVADELLEIKEEKYVEAKDDLLGAIFKSGEEIKLPVLETTYYYQQWREHAMTVIKTAVRNAVDEQFKALELYDGKLAEEYSEHINHLIVDMTAEKDKTTELLSEEEIRLQEDSDWLITFKDFVSIIERG